MTDPVLSASSPERGRIGIVGMCALIAALVACAALVQYGCVLLGVDSQIAEHVLPVPAIATVLALAALNAGILALTRRPMLSRAQLICVTWGVLLASPAFTQGFWHRFIGAVSTFARDEQFAYIDAMPDRLWPHGSDLLAGATPDAGPEAGVVIAEGKPLDLPVPAAGDEPLSGRPFLVTALVAAPELPPGGRIICALVGDESEIVAWRIDQATISDSMRDDGFQRVGAYGVRPPQAVRGVTMRISCTQGVVARVCNVRMLSVGGLESVLHGRQPVTPARWDQLDEPHRAASLRVDGNAGVAGLVGTGGVAWSEWVVCVGAWASFLALLMGAVFGFTMLMRRPWIEHERLPLPLAKGLGRLIGIEGQGIWRSPWLWGAFAVALLWCQTRYWHTYNEAVPDASISVPLQQFFKDPGWGKMWETKFTVSAMFLGIALYFELNILASLVIGYWMYRSIHWAGQQTGMDTEPGFPWRGELQIGGYLAYFAVILYLARRHLAGVAKRIVVGERIPSADPLSARAAFLLLLVSCLGAMVWCWWVGVGSGGFAVLFAYFIIIGVVSARLRAECGLLFGYFTPANATLILSIFGGVATFGPQAVLFGFMASMFFVSTSFHVPGAQFELMEVGRREGIRTRTTAIIAIAGLSIGVLVGGWTLLTLSSAIGGDNLRYAWVYDTKMWYFQSFANEVNALQNKGADPGGSPTAIAIGAVATGLVAILRQMFAGFWLHPVGVLLAPTYVMDSVWGSCTVALALRFAAVRSGGAESVRERLLPAGLGIFLAGAATCLIAIVHGTVMLHRSGVVRVIMGDMP